MNPFSNGIKKASSPSELLDAEALLIEFSKVTIAQHLHIYVLSGCLPDICLYLVDAFIHQYFQWKIPDQNHLVWWNNLRDEREIENWHLSGYHNLNIGWELSVASSYFSASSALFGEQLDSLFFERRHLYERAYCRVLNFGSRYGLSLEISIALESSSSDEEIVISNLQDGVKIVEEVVSLADVSSGIPQILTGARQGEWLPPIRYGDDWVVLKVNAIHRPSRSELAPILLRRAMREWRSSHCNKLTTYWINQFSPIKSDD